MFFPVWYERYRVGGASPFVKGFVMYLVLRCMFLVVFQLLLLPLTAHATPFETTQVVKLLEQPAKPSARSDPLKIDEIKASHSARKRAFGVEIDNINFLIGDPVVQQAEAQKLHELALAVRKILKKHPNEVFLVEGHTDATGKQEYNMPLSQYRAAAVKSTLVVQYQIPERNIAVVGYGSEFLKIKTSTPERANRRITVRRVTDLLRPRRQLHLGKYIQPASQNRLARKQKLADGKQLTPAPVYPRTFPRIIIPSFKFLF